MKIGSFGDILFEVNDSKILTYEKKHSSQTSMYGSQNVINSKPILTFMGNDLNKVTLSIRVERNLMGFTPEDIKTKIDKMMKNGTYAYLILGTSVKGENPFVIRSYNQDELNWDTKGNCTHCVFDIELIEYVPEV